MDVTSGSLGRPLNNLQNKVLIEHYKGVYEIADLIFKYWLKNEYETLGFYPYQPV